jgi:hypothetical protein
MDGNGDERAANQDLRSSLGFASSPHQAVMTPFSDTPPRPARVPADSPTRRGRPSPRRRPIDESTSEGQIVIDLLHALTEAVQRQAEAVDNLVERVDALSAEFDKLRGDDWDGWSVMAGIANHLTTVETGLAELQARLEGAASPKRR